MNESLGFWRAWLVLYGSQSMHISHLKSLIHLTWQTLYQWHSRSRISFQTSILQTQSAQLSPFQLFLSIKCLLFLRICPSWPSHILSDGLCMPAMRNCAQMSCGCGQHGYIRLDVTFLTNRGCMSALFRCSQCCKTLWVLCKLIYAWTTIFFFCFFFFLWKKKMGVYQDIVGWLKAEWKMTSATNNHKLLAYYYKSCSKSVIGIMTM